MTKFGTFLLSVGVFFVLTGMSRPLEYKEAKSKFTLAPKGITLDKEAHVYFAENTNNQGCMSRQKLDTLVKFKIVNRSKKPLTLYGSKAVLTHLKKAYPMPISTYQSSSKAAGTSAKSGIIIKPGATGIFSFRIAGFLPKKHLATTDTLDFKVSTSQGDIRCSFKGMKKLPTKSGFRTVRFE